MLPFVAGTALAGAGALLGYRGQREANAANQAMAFQANRYGQSNMRESFAFNRQEAEYNRAFQRDMSNTSYQRATEDMKKAGINPMLAYMQGGASTPGGSAASGSGAAGVTGNAMQNVHGNTGKAIEAAVSSALKASDIKRAYKQTNSQVGLNASQKGKVEAETANAKITKQILEAEKKAKQEESKLRQGQAKVGQKLLWVDEIGKRGGNIIDKLKVIHDQILKQQGLNSAQEAINKPKKTKRQEQIFDKEGEFKGGKQIDIIQD